jgi:hypothetical protein
MQPVQQNRLAGASQSEQHHALGRPPEQHAIQINGRLFKKPVASSQLRRLQPGSGHVGIVARSMVRL